MQRKYNEISANSATKNALIAVICGQPVSGAIIPEPCVGTDNLMKRLCKEPVYSKENTGLFRRKNRFIGPEKTVFIAAAPRNALLFPYMDRCLAR